MKPTKRLSFNIERTKASFIDPSGALVEHVIEIREEGGNGGRLTYNLYVE